MVSLDLIRSACLEGQSNREAYNEVVLLRAWNMHSKFLCSPWTLKFVHFGLGQGQHLPFKSSQSCIVFCRYVSPNKCTLPEFHFDMKPTKNENGRLVHEQIFLWFRVLLGSDRFLWVTLMISYDYREAAPEFYPFLKPKMMEKFEKGSFWLPMTSSAWIAVIEMIHCTLVGWVRCVAISRFVSEHDSTI